MLECGGDVIFIQEQTAGDLDMLHNNEGTEGRIYKGGKAYWPREREKDVVGDRSNLQESF